MGPELQPDVPLIEVLLYGALNPATIATAFLVGRKATNFTQLMIAAFAGAAAGFALLFVVTLFRLWDSPTLARAAAGVFVVSLVAGLAYAGIGRMTKK